MVAFPKNHMQGTHNVASSHNAYRAFHVVDFHESDYENGHENDHENDYVNDYVGDDSVFLCQSLC